MKPLITAITIVLLAASPVAARDKSAPHEYHHEGHQSIILRPGDRISIPVPSPIKLRIQSFSPVNVFVGKCSRVQTTDAVIECESGSELTIVDMHNPSMSIDTVKTNQLGRGDRGNRIVVDYIY